MKITHGSFFTCTGGVDLAAEEAGYKNLFYCEADPNMLIHLANRFPNVKAYNDIRTFDGKQYGGGAQLTLFQEDSPVRISALHKPVLGTVRPALKGKSPVCGFSTPVFYGKLCPESYTLKTAQCSLVEDLNTSYATFPNSGIMLNGDCYTLPSSAIPISGRGFLVWPTPNATDSTRLLKRVESYKKYLSNGHQDKMVYQCHLNGMTASQTIAVYCWMMGFPPNWIMPQYSDTGTL